MDDESHDHTRIVLLEAELKQTREDLGRVRTIVNEIERRDQSRMRAAIVALGAIVLSLLTYIWTTIVGVAR